MYARGVSTSDLSKRSPGFEHPRFGAFVDKTTHYEGLVDGLRVALDLPEAISLLDPHEDLSAWARGRTEASAARLKPLAPRHWASLDEAVLARELRLVGITATWTTDRVTLHYAWGTEPHIDASTSFTAAGNIAHADIEIRPYRITLPSIGEVEVRETRARMEFVADVGGVEIAFSDEALAPRVATLVTQLEVSREAARRASAAGLVQTWNERWRDGEPTLDEATLAARLTLARLEVEPAELRWKFEDGGAFLGHAVVVEQAGEEFREPYLEG